MVHGGYITKAEYKAIYIDGDLDYTVTNITGTLVQTTAAL